MMLSPSICGAVAAVLLAPFFWTAAASAFRALLHRPRGDISLSDVIEKLVLTLMLAPSVMGLVAVLMALLPAPQSAPTPLLDFGFADVAVDAPIAAPLSAPGAVFPWLRAGVSAFAWIYGAGALIAALRVLAAQARLWRLAAHAQDAQAQWGKGVAIADTGAPPFVAAGGNIILPRALIAALTPAQMALVIAHERAHVRRGDTLYYALLAWADALFWFNPFVRAQTRRCRLAAELACDAAVTAAAPEMLRAYAQALLLALTHTAGDALQCAPAVFSTRSVGEHRMRISEIMRAAAGRRKRSAWAVYIAAGLLAAPLGMLQIAVAQTNGAPHPATAQTASQAAAAVATLFAIAPLQTEVTSPYGPRTDPHYGGAQFHTGVDYRAAEGAAIVAPAAGRVLRARVPQEKPGFGKVLEIDHGGGLVTRYAHLSEFDVEVGQQVAAGQLIARAGNTGISTGPHLHFEVLRDGRTIDPETVLPPRSAH
jgi:murein DD-endopeptidase MepM/ murein hydrolase activator NlpD